jgi:signal transduction histidine kinase
MIELVQDTFADAYAGAFREYLSEPGEAALAQAYELGRTAAVGHLGVLELAIAHSRVVAEVLQDPMHQAHRERLLDASERFLLEALAPFEMANRGFHDAGDVLRRVNDLLEGQARRIAYALHDEASQMLASVHLGLADAASTAPAATVRQLHKVRGLLEDVEDRLRTISHELRPPILDDLGLVKALEFLCESASKRWQLSITLEASLGRALAATVETTLYRITQEALTNVNRHARATQVHVSLTRACRIVRCSIRDNGVGFASARSGPPPGLGLEAIRERVSALGGLVGVASNEDGGAQLTIEIPVEN